MAHTRSAKKRIRQNAKRRMRNKAVRTSVKTRIKSFLAAIEKKDLQMAERMLNICYEYLDKAWAKGVIHRNQASRKKSRLASKLASLKDSLTASSASPA